jgi:hypothetical protein
VSSHRGSDAAGGSGTGGSNAVDGNGTEYYDCYETSGWDHSDASSMIHLDCVRQKDSSPDSPDYLGCFGHMRNSSLNMSCIEVHLDDAYDYYYYESYGDEDLEGCYGTLGVSATDATATTGLLGNLTSLTLACTYNYEYYGTMKYSRNDHVCLGSMADYALYGHTGWDNWCFLNVGCETNHSSGDVGENYGAEGNYGSMGDDGYEDSDVGEMV